MIRVLSDRNIIHRVGLSVFIGMTDKSLDLPFSLSMSLFSSAVLHPPLDILDLSVFPMCSRSSVGISASACQCESLCLQDVCSSFSLKVASVEF